jgi:hypothetical protein
MNRAGVAVAAYGLPSEHTFPDRPLAADEFAALLATCQHEGVLGFLGAAVRDSALDVGPEHHDALERELRRWSAHAVRVEQLALRAMSELAAVGIAARVLKGVALAHTTYPQREQRVFGDVDLLVPSPDFTRAAEVLSASLHGRHDMPELRPGFDDRFGDEVMLRVESLELDLHRTFVEGAFGLTVDLDDLFAPPYRFALGGYELEALPMPQRLLHACYAAALGGWPPRLVSLRDVAEIVLRERPNLVDVLLMAKRWRCEAVVARAVATAWHELAITTSPPIVDWADAYAPNRMERLLLASHEGPARAFTRHLAAIIVLPNLADRFRYARAIAVPQASYLRVRHLSPATHLQRATRRIFR